MALKVNFRWLSFLGGGLRNWNSGEELNFYEGLFQFPPRPLGHLIVSWHKRALNCSQQFKNLSSSEWSWCLLTVAQVLLGKRRNSCIANLFVFCSRLQLSNECCTCADPTSPHRTKPVQCSVPPSQVPQPTCSWKWGGEPDYVPPTAALQ